VLDIDPAVEESQKGSVEAWRAGRDQDGVASALSQVGAVAATDQNLMVAIKDALAVGATVGEVSDSLREVFGVYRPGAS
ncbi:MAG: methylmalonyl-CoA mutase family protein, partial [Acidimicrobiia bacterium]